MAEMIPTPQIGEIRLGWKVGSKSDSRHIYCACLDCGKARWVPVNRDSMSKNLRCKSCAAKLRQNNWKDGRTRTEHGYILIRMSPNDFFFSMANSARYVMEHRLVMAKHLGRCLHLWELVHHKNGIRNDNRVENLQLVQEMQHNQITKLGVRIKLLEARVDEQAKLIKLLQWQNKERQMEVKYE